MFLHQSYDKLFPSARPLVLPNTNEQGFCSILSKTHAAFWSQSIDFGLQDYGKVELEIPWAGCLDLHSRGIKFHPAVLHGTYFPVQTRHWVGD